MANITNSQSQAPSPSGELLFKPFFVQKGVGPHLGDLHLPLTKTAILFHRI